ncbi:YidH family protein [Stenotrophomonas bentonitica]|uniref:YidH family protein n=1 Tax=Stenotrophomonas bentonitica TaxID=1450134 RepID=UPI00345E2EAF
MTDKDPRRALADRAVTLEQAEATLGSADAVSLELSSRRTGMSFQRTRMSADRTLMSIIRTALSLIGFGFTIFQFFGHMLQVPGVAMNPHAPRNFGTALVFLGMVMLTLGIVYHLRYMQGLRAERTQMKREGLIHGESHYPISLTLITAGLLWLLGLMAIAGMTFNIAPFG